MGAALPAAAGAAGGSGIGTASSPISAFARPAAFRALGGRGRYSTIPVESSANRLRCVSSFASGIIATTSRALSVPSTRERT